MTVWCSGLLLPSFFVPIPRFSLGHKCPHGPSLRSKAFLRKGPADYLSTSTSLFISSNPSLFYSHMKNNSPFPFLAQLVPSLRIFNVSSLVSWGIFFHQNLSPSLWSSSITPLLTVSTFHRHIQRFLIQLTSSWNRLKQPSSRCTCTCMRTPAQPLVPSTHWMTTPFNSLPVLLKPYCTNTSPTFSHGSLLTTVLPDVYLYSCVLEKLQASKDLIQWL